MNVHIKQNNTHKLHSYWLFLCSFMVLSMILIGGLTRLTNSGLSMVEWKPVTGIIPPFSAEAWLVEFEKYKQYPEFLKVNYAMSLDEFKFIYLFEFIHRLFGRLTGLVFILPFIYFIFKKHFAWKEIKEMSLICLLVGLQGFMGWYMVKSGLVNHPDVSPFRLSIHLTMAFIIISLVFYRGLRFSNISLIKTTENQKIIRFSNFIIFLTFVQVFLGGMVAGNDAGLVYNEFPLMGDSLIPNELYDSEIGGIFSDPVIIQFMHRVFAFLLFSAIICFIKISYGKFANCKNKKRSLQLIFIAIISQMLLGILTLVYHVPIILASAHQIGAAFLLICIIYNNFLLKYDS